MRSAQKGCQPRSLHPDQVMSSEEAVSEARGFLAHGRSDHFLVCGGRAQERAEEWRIRVERQSHQTAPAESALSSCAAKTFKQRGKQRSEQFFSLRVSGIQLRIRRCHAHV